MRNVTLAMLLLWTTAVTLMAQPDQYNFMRLDGKKGLSHSAIMSILRDSRGFMWFGTATGLNRYDGYTLKTFRHDARDSASIRNNTVLNLFEGPEGTIWLETRNGFDIYDPDTEKFDHHPDRFLRRYSIPEPAIRQIIKGKDGSYWFVTDQSGLYQYTGPRQPTRRISHRPADTTSLHSNQITFLTQDGQGNIWVIHRSGVIEKIHPVTHKVSYRNQNLSRNYPGEGLNYRVSVDADGDLWVYVEEDARGVFYISPLRRRFIHLHKESPRTKLNTNIVRGVVQDNKGLIWIATDHGGVNLLSKRNFTVRYLLHNPEDEKSISQNSINALYKDYEGIVWLGTFKQGLSYYHESFSKFPLYKRQASDPASLPYNDINRFVEDAKGNIWIGTNGGGLLYFDRATGRFTQFLHDPNNPNSLSNNIIVSLLIDHQQKLWIGTYFGGLNCYDGKTFIRYRHNPAVPESLSDDRIWEIFEDSRKNLWIGTLGNGLDRFDRERNVFYHYRAGAPNSIHTNYISALTEDQEGNLWVGTGYGVEVLNPKTDRFTHYLSRPTPGSLSNNNILAVLEDSRGLIWIGTQDGLNVFDKRRNTFRAFRKEDGLPDNSIATILEDHRGHLWLGTSQGLSQLTIGKGKAPEEYSFRFANYDASDGLQGNEFNENAALKTSRGELIFAGANGFNWFHPDSMRANRSVQRLALTDFQLFNKSVRVAESVNGRTLLHKSISQMKEIVLKPGENVFSIEFAALDFRQPEKIKYSYLLEGFNTEWLLADQQVRKATFTNLNPGEYLFRIKASSADGTANQANAHLKITVLPPFWKTRTALVLYIVGIVGALLLARQLTLERERLNFRMEQERQEAQRMHELDLFKIKFFTNVSHEFRTPLTLIITPLDKLVKTVKDPDVKNQLLLVHRNARRLLNLVNQLLDFRKMEEQEIKLNPTEGDVVQFVKDITYSFSDISEKKHIQLSFGTHVAQVITLFDPDKLEKILFNLLSNAFKFTPEGGKVEVALDLPGPEGTTDETLRLQIAVCDTGIGIPAEKHEKIFERFFQHDIPGTMVNQGSGIGLAITKEFVKLHGGTISVTSEPEKGACFTVRLPIRTLSEYVPAGQPITEAIGLAASNGHPEGGAPSENGAHKRKKPSVLLVEDNEDFRFYLKDNLREYYRIVEAGNGKEGWQQATALIPDLIVSDIMMPEMNGIELCRKLKNDKRTSHIPVILLTARAADEQKLEGYQTGANDYVTKPFNFEILQSRIRNLIVQQEVFRQAFGKRLEVAPNDIEVTSLDEKLIKKAVETVEKKMADPDFSVEELSHELGMSRVHLYKKLLSLTGKSPIEFIRTIRLKRAAQLLEKSQLTVSEIAYQVGFNNPKYFTKYFKAEFNVLPSVYAAQKQQTNA